MGEVASAVGRAPVPLVEAGTGPSSALGPGAALATAFWAHTSWVGAASFYQPLDDVEESAPRRH